MKVRWLCLFLCSAAQALTWEKANPAGTRGFRWMAIDGKDIVTLSGDAGTYWSADQGKTWSGGSPSAAPVKYTYAGTSVSGMERYAFLAHPDGDLFAIEAVNKGPIQSWPITLFRSADHGFTWVSQSDSLPYDPAEPDALGWDLRCAPNGHLFIMYHTAVSRSNALRVSLDKGQTWEKKGDLAGYSAYAVDGESRLYCLGSRQGSGNSILFQSQDDGATWDSLYLNRNGYGADLAAGGNGNVAIFYSNILAARLSGEASVKVSALDYLGNSADVFAVGPEGEILSGASYRGVVKVNKALDAQTLLNDGLGADTASEARELRYDSKGNLYYLVGENLYILRAGGSAIRPLAPARPRPSSVREYDLSGRRMQARHRAGMRVIQVTN